jgi:deoxyribonuclease IV
LAAGSRTPAGPGAPRAGAAPGGPDLRIGPGGVPMSAHPRTTEAGVRRLRELGLGHMELEFVNGVRMGEEAAGRVARAAAESDVSLTVHGPYYINFNSRDPAIRERSQERLFQTARIGALCGAHSFTFHAAFTHGDPPEDVHRTVREALRALQRRIRDAGIRIDIRPELTGKPSQYGSLDDLLRLSQEVPGVYPCIDFSHYHARHGGGQNGYASFSRTLEQVGAALGRGALDRLHMHVSGIEYGPGGERRHLPLPDADFRYAELMQALWDHRVGGWVVCESPVLEEDALRLKQAYARAVQRKAGAGSGRAGRGAPGVRTSKEAG